MFRALRFIFLFLAPVFLIACGYRFDCENCLGCAKTLSLAPIKGDWDGDLTAALTAEIARSGCFEYRRTGGAVTLQVSLTDFDDENIGFRYERNKRGHIRKAIIPTETRITAIAEVSLVEEGSGQVLFGPVEVKAQVDFDHDYYASRKNAKVNVFSLGQLTDYDDAYEDALRPLNRVLAQKIADLISG